MAIAARAKARFGGVAALLVLTLLAGHETPREPARPARVAALVPPTIAPLGKTIVPGPFADAHAWPRGMVIAPPETGDPMAFGVVPAPGPGGRHPVVDLLSGLFEALSSRGA